VAQTTDARIAPVEDNLLEFLARMSAHAMFRSDGHPDVTTYWSTIDHPLFNGLVAGTFPPGTAAQRASEAIAPFVARGRPFLWWSTPSTWSTDLHAALTAAGMAHDSSPGMHASLRDLPPPVTAPDLRIEMVTPTTHATMTRVMVEGFEMPASLAGPIDDALSGFPPEQLVQVLAFLGDRPVSAGSLFVTGATGGLYNIATLPAARGRGVGYAVTRALMALARERGCIEAVLDASPLGLPVYERLGFVEVCQVPQYVWTPDG
jgi:ribosomal protein S18 acetylase RimI-like enzyme